MKLTSKDKKLLMLLLVVVIAACAFVFGYRPLKTANGDLDLKLKNLQKQDSSYAESIKGSATILDEIKNEQDKALIYEGQVPNVVAPIYAETTFRKELKIEERDDFKLMNTVPNLNSTNGTYCYDIEITIRRDTYNDIKNYMDQIQSNPFWEVSYYEYSPKAGDITYELAKLKVRRYVSNPQAPKE
ncbi:MAG: hypothetical protein RR123_01060 [Clostridia bacterium]